MKNVAYSKQLYNNKFQVEAFLPETTLVLFVGVQRSPLGAVIVVVIAVVVVVVVVVGSDLGIEELSGFHPETHVSGGHHKYCMHIP